MVHLTFFAADAAKDEESGSYLLDISEETDKTVRRTRTFSLKERTLRIDCTPGFFQQISLFSMFVKDVVKLLQRSIIERFCLYGHSTIRFRNVCFSTAPIGLFSKRSFVQSQSLKLQLSTCYFVLKIYWNFYYDGLSVQNVHYSFHSIKSKLKNLT